MHVFNFTFQTDGASYLEVSKAIDFRLAQQVGIKGIDILFLQAFIDINDVLQFLEEPPVDLGQFVDTVDGIFRLMHRFRNHEDTLVCRFA